MLDFTYMDMPIEVHAARPRLDMIMSRLRQEGFRPFAADLTDESDRCEPLFLDAKSAADFASAPLGRRKLEELKRPIVIFDGGPGAPSNTCIHIERQDEFYTLKRRLDVLRRRRLVEDEAALRRETLTALSGSPFEKPQGAHPRALFVGSGSSVFLGFSKALEAGGIDCKTALTESGALDLIGAMRFDGVVIAESVATEQASRWLDLIEAAPSLLGAPVFILQRDSDVLSDAVARRCTETGARLVRTADFDTALHPMLDAISAQALAAPICADMVGDDVALDPGVRLFTRSFLEAHLERQLAYADREQLAFSILSLRLRGHEDRPMDAVKALRRIADAITPALRVVDAAARVERHTLAIALPATTYRGAADLSSRLKRGLAARPATLGDLQQIEWRAIERRRYHSPEMLIKSALAGPYAALEIAA